LESKSALWAIELRRAAKNSIWHVVEARRETRLIDGLAEGFESR